MVVGAVGEDVGFVVVGFVVGLLVVGFNTGLLVGNLVGDTTGTGAGVGTASVEYP